MPPSRHTILLGAFLLARPPATRALTLGVAGAQGRLGRELVAQGLARGWEVRAIVRRPDDPIWAPVRVGWLDEPPDAARRALASSRLRPAEDASAVDALVIATSGRPFAADDGDALATRLCASLTRRCRAVCLVSAHGVGESADGADAGIQAMRAWYLRSVYASKERQEALVRACATERGVAVKIVRPRVLSMTRVPLNPVATPRSELAAELLDWVDAATARGRPRPSAEPRTPPT